MVVILVKPEVASSYSFDRDIVCNNSNFWHVSTVESTLPLNLVIFTNFKFTLCFFIRYHSEVQKTVEITSLDWIHIESQKYIYVFKYIYIVKLYINILSKTEGLTKYLTDSAAEYEKLNTNNLFHVYCEVEKY